MGSASKEGAPGGTGKQATLSLALIAGCLFQLPMGMIWSTIGLIVLPFEAEKFYPERHSGFLGVLLTIAGTSQVEGGEKSFMFGNSSVDKSCVFLLVDK